MNSFQDKSINKNNRRLSVILPTFNESQNIIKMLESIQKVIPTTIMTEIIVVDDDSPDGTGNIVEEYIKNSKNGTISIKVICRKNKRGLSSAILDGVKSSRGEVIVVMDSDFAHPPEKILEMLEEIQNNQVDIVVGSRYVKGGETIGWTTSRKIISFFATKIAEYFLGVKVKDSMSGFFSFKKQIIENKQFDALGYKLLLEILVKTKNAKVKEIPYKCINRKEGSSKFNTSIIMDYIKLVLRLKKYKKHVRERPE